MQCAASCECSSNSEQVSPKGHISIGRLKHSYNLLCITGVCASGAVGNCIPLQIYLCRAKVI